jgi:hypothetical protein
MGFPCRDILLFPPPLQVFFFLCHRFGFRTLISKRHHLNFTFMMLKRKCEEVGRRGEASFNLIKISCTMKIYSFYASSILNVEKTEREREGLIVNGIFINIMTLSSHDSSLFSVGETKKSFYRFKII